MQFGVTPFFQTEEAKAMQREFAAVALRIHGYLDDAYVATYAPTSSPDLSPREVREESGRVNVSGMYEVPPIAAYLDGIYPLKIHVARSGDGAGAVYSVALSVPKGTNRRGGPVTLVWPGQSVVCNQPIIIQRASCVGAIGIIDGQVSPERMLSLPNVAQEPIEVHLAGAELSPDDWEWSSRSGLIIRIPDHLDGGTVLVVTDTRVLQSGYLSFVAQD